MGWLQNSWSNDTSLSSFGLARYFFYPNNYCITLLICQWNFYFLKTTGNKNLICLIRKRFTNNTYVEDITRQCEYKTIIEWGRVGFEELLRQRFVCDTDRGLNNSSYPTRTEFNNCFIIYLYLQTFPLKKPFVFSRIWHKKHKLVWRHNVV